MAGILGPVTVSLAEWSDVEHSYAIPNRCLVLLLGCSSAGKSTLAHRCFAPEAIVSKDALRAALGISIADRTVLQELNALATEAVRARLEAGGLAVVDATNVRAEDRRGPLAVARAAAVPAIAIVVGTDVATCWQRTQERPDRFLARQVLEQQWADLVASRTTLTDEGVDQVIELATASDLDHVTITTVR